MRNVLVHPKTTISENHNFMWNVDFTWHEHLLLVVEPFFSCDMNISNPHSRYFSKFWGHSKQWKKGCACLMQCQVTPHTSSWFLMQCKLIRKKTCNRKKKKILRNKKKISTEKKCSPQHIPFVVFYRNVLLLMCRFLIRHLVCNHTNVLKQCRRMLILSKLTKLVHPFQIFTIWKFNMFTIDGHTL